MLGPPRPQWPPGDALLVCAAVDEAAVEDPDPAVGQRVEGSEVAVAAAPVGQVVGASSRRVLRRAERPLEAGVGRPAIVSGPRRHHPPLPGGIEMAGFAEQSTGSCQAAGSIVGSSRHQNGGPVGPSGASPFRTDELRS
jgi:hypothetical protein